MSNKIRLTVTLSWKAILHIFFFFLSLEKDFFLFGSITYLQIISNIVRLE